MAIVDTTAIDIPVPHEKDASFGFRRLPWVDLKQARQIEESAQRVVAREFGAAFVSEIAKGEEGNKEAVLDAMDDAQYRASNFDTFKLLELGIVHWSGETYDGVKVSKKSISQLDAITADWAAQQIVDITRPPTEEETKKA